MSDFYTYIARCSDGSLYTGYCKNLEERETKHNTGKGAKYTATRRPIQIIYSEIFSSKSEAMQREYEIKTWTKKKKELLVGTGSSEV